MRRDCPVLREGSLKMLCEGENLLAYGRFNWEERIIVAMNSGSEELYVELPVWETGISRTAEAEVLTEIFRTDRTGFHEEKKEYMAAAGILSVRLLPQSAYIFLHREKIRK